MSNRDPSRISASRNRTDACEPRLTVPKELPGTTLGVSTDRQQALTHRPRGQERVVPKGAPTHLRDPAKDLRSNDSDGVDRGVLSDPISSDSGKSGSLRSVVDQLIAIAEQLRAQDNDAALPANHGKGHETPSGAVKPGLPLAPGSGRLRAIDSIEDNMGEAPALTIQQRRKKFAEMARATYAQRRKRAVIFGDPELFGEPGWDILLDLYIAHAEEKAVSVSSACIGSASPPTTGLRWLGVLSDQGLVQREHDPDDQRRVLIQLTEKGLKAMDEYFSCAPSTLGDRRTSRG